MARSYMVEAGSRRVRPTLGPLRALRAACAGAKCPRYVAVSPGD